MENRTSFTNLQQELLKIYGTNIPDSQLLEIKELLGNYFAQKATDQMDDFMMEQGLTAEDMVKWSNEHNRSREDRS